ncbi:hypothetical protein M5D96_001816 [Drosophila gunungcola]|uniref:Uncharacterized protein n=1 Tax=Drosophila gunungcola TaxID=103775 RepID=A0A9P9YYT5_9MUSC|nr:hypothetical protein M5D96_001816 [Drosophila gunungcola]
MSLVPFSVCQLLDFMAAIAATPGLELELTLGQVDFVNGPIPKNPNPISPKCAKQVSQLTEAEKPRAGVRHNPNTCGNASSKLSHDAHAPAACLGGAMLIQWWWLLRWLLLLLLLLLLLRARKCNAMSRQRGNEVWCDCAPKGKSSH